VTRIGVVIPVGPRPSHQRYLQELMTSIALQTRPADQLVFVDDMANLELDELSDMYRRFSGRAIWPDIHIVRNWWLLGVAASFNAGVAYATIENDLAFMMGADDVMRPTCLEETVRCFKEHGDQDAYYYAGLSYMDTLEEQTVPCNAAAVTRGLWQMTGGFPVESAVGAPDCALVSIMMTYMNSRLIPIAGGAPLVDYRRHAETDTATRGAAWQGPILESRNILTRDWKAPDWGRM